LDDSLDGTFDVVISQNSFEHLRDPAGTLATMRRLLAPAGEILITFCPPWFAPYGAHMGYFTKIPWVQLLFSEHTVMSVRSRFRSDGATRYEDVEMGLNRMSIRKFERIVRNSGLKVAWRKYVCVKKLNALGRIPLVRELFINVVSCALVQE
jgi:SAM-dependent methyltransferase